jgi:hypothetical protein
LQNLNLQGPIEHATEEPKVLLNPLYPARVMSETRNHSKLTSSITVDANPHPLFYDEVTGLYRKPVTHTMLDVEDLIYNKQFLKMKESINEDGLKEKFKAIHEKRILTK